MKMVLRDPCGIEAGLLRMHDLLGRQAISFRRRRLIEKPRKKPQSLQIYQTLHSDLLQAASRNILSLSKRFGKQFSRNRGAPRNYGLPYS
jgi:hypothetical protein